MALSIEQDDALGYLRELLRSYGLEELTDWAYEQVVKGNSPTVIRQLLWEQPAFRRRFKVIFDRQDKGLPAISPAEVLDYERRARQLFQEAGLPPGFYDNPDDFYSFLANDVSLSELNGRIELARSSLYSADQTQRSEMKRLYGLTEGQEISYLLDPSRALPLLQLQFNAARTSATATKSGYGNLSLAEAESLSRAGVSDEQAQSGFGNLVRGRQLFNPLPGYESTEDAISRDEQLTGAFLGNALAEERIRRRAEARVAAFGGGGGFVSDREGFAGLGSTNK